MDKNCLVVLIVVIVVVSLLMYCSIVDKEKETLTSASTAIDIGRQPMIDEKVVKLSSGINPIRSIAQLSKTISNCHKTVDPVIEDLDIFDEPFTVVSGSSDWGMTGPNIDLTYDDHHSRPLNKTYAGLVLFDVDGTLTTGKDNYRTVQLFLDRNWAVGIVTAGAVYTQQNIARYYWMPINLTHFLLNTGFVTFNNVAGNPPILCGKPALLRYASVDRRIPMGIDGYGYRKGHALFETGLKLGLDPKHVLICDDLLSFIQGVKVYDSAFQTLHNPKGLSFEQCKTFLDKF